MANFNTINAYDADARIPTFRGLMQYGDGINADPRYAMDAVNVVTPAGVLQPFASCLPAAWLLPAPIETLAFLYRRYPPADGNSGSSAVLGNCIIGTMVLGQDGSATAGDKNILIAASDGALYYLSASSHGWHQLPYPDGVDYYQSNKWSWCVYEINPEGSTAPVDVMLLSNAKDGMVMVRGDMMTVSVVATPKKFGIIERYAERIWGGAIDDDPDMLVYSAPYDPTNWEATPEIPEDGAGDILQPSWDGDRFTALRSFGSQLIAFKRTRVWRVLGTDPGEYTFKEQYGGGAPYASTIAVSGEKIYMLTPQGIVYYDGVSVAPFYQEYAKGIFDRMTTTAIDGACACVFQGNYYCAIPIDGSAINNAVLVYSEKDGTWLLRDDISVESFLATEDSLYFTSATTPGQYWTWRDDSWTCGDATTAPVKWVTPWNDLNYKHYLKGGFEVYLTCEVKRTPVTLTVAIQTEKKIKEKKVTFLPLTEEEIEAGKTCKQKRMHFGGTGRRFRMIVSATAQPPWRLVGGVMVKAEIDPD